MESPRVPNERRIGVPSSNPLTALFAASPLRLPRFEASVALVVVGVTLALPAVGEGARCGAVARGRGTCQAWRLLVVQCKGEALIIPDLLGLSRQVLFGILGRQLVPHLPSYQSSSLFLLLLLLLLASPRQQVRASGRSQGALLDLNSRRQIAVGTTGPQHATQQHSHKHTNTKHNDKHN